MLIHLGTGSGFSAKPDQQVSTDGASIATVQLADVTGDGRLDLVIPSIRMGLLSILRMLTSSSLPVVFQLHAGIPGHLFAPKPTATRELTFNLDLGKGGGDTQVAKMTFDVNGDGSVDLVFGTGKNELSIFAGGKPGVLFDANALTTVAVGAAGEVVGGHLSDAKRTDLVLWYPSTVGHQHELVVVRAAAK